jgi:aldose 1-epimerase
MSEPTPRFRVSTGEHLGEQVIVLADDVAETQAILVPSFGFPCIAFRVGLDDGAWNVVAEPPDAEQFRTRVGRFGVPLMFPWPNRVRDGRFTFAGHEYTLPLPARGPHAIHGLTRDRPWTVGRTGVDDAAFCRASIRIGASPNDPWPFPARLAVEYRLFDRSLDIHAEAENAGSTPMPMGFGIHPWFDVPFGSAAPRDAMELRAPAEGYWELDETLCTIGPVRAVTDGIDLRAWSPIAGRFIDDVYTDLTLEDGWFTAEVRDPANGRSIAVRSDAGFREHVVFAPLHSDVVCLEPYTCATDAFNLAERGIDSGRMVLEPGKTWRGAIQIIARP